MKRNRMIAMSAGLLVGGGLLGVAIAATPSVATQDAVQSARDLRPLPAEWFSPSIRDEHRAMVGKKMPEIKNEQLTGWMNKEFDLSKDLKGKVVVLDFWATWCGPCLAGIPKNNEFWNGYKDQDVVFIAICGSSGQENMERVAADRNIQFPIVKDHTQEVAKAFNVRFWPTYVVIDREGIVRGAGIRASNVEDAVKFLLEEQPGQQRQDAPRREVAEQDLKPLPAEWFFNKPEELAARHNAMLGKDMPEIKNAQLTGWMNKEFDTEKDLKGNIVVIDFWATWCGPCIAAIPKANTLWEKYQEEGVIFLGICGSRGQENMERIAEQHNIQFPIAKDHTQELARSFNVGFWPTYVIIDRNGKVRGVGLNTNHVEDAIKHLLQEQPRAVAQH